MELTWITADCWTSATMRSGRQDLPDPQQRHKHHLGLRETSICTSSPLPYSVFNSMYMYYKSSSSHMITHSAHRGRQNRRSQSTQSPSQLYIFAVTQFCQPNLCELFHEFCLDRCNTRPIHWPLFVYQKRPMYWSSATQRKSFEVFIAAD